MEEMAQGSVAESSVIGNSPSTNVAPQEAAQPSEKVFRQADVDNIVKRVKHDAVESYKRMQTQQPDYAQQKFGSDSVSSQYQQPTQYQNLSVDDVRRLAAEESQRLRDQWINETAQKSYEENAQRTVQEFFNKVNTGREKYSDFDNVTGDIELARFPNTVQLLAQYVDNADAVLYDLGKDRIKLANLEALAERSPKDAIVQAQRLGKSLKENEQAVSTKLPREPLNQLRPSNTGTDNGVMSVSDYRKKYIV